MARRRIKKYQSEPIGQSKNVKNPSYRTVDVYRKAHTLSELENIRRTLAKQANQRIVRLERASSNITGERYNTFGAITDVYDYLDKSNRRRFSEATKYKGNLDDLRYEIATLQGFLGRKTSTVAGMREIEKKRINTFESGKWGSYHETKKKNKPIKFASNKEFYDFLNSATFRELVNSGFTSEQIVEKYANVREKKSDNDVTEKMNLALRTFRKGKVQVNLKNLDTLLGVQSLK